MFPMEAHGLQLLRNSESFTIPEVIAQGDLNEVSYLLLNYISSAEKKENFWELYAENLAKLHQTSNLVFGLEEDNYIGSLPQFNKIETKNAIEFYIENRLRPQLHLAQKNGFQFKNLHSFFKNIEKIIPLEKPSLIHGDLWNGNYLIDSQGKPALIDPAVAFAIREMDLAMMQLFGGFPEEVFLIYEEIYPLEKEWKNRIELWQLYYLLVHLNLFGSGYFNSVDYILKKYN